MVPKIALGLSDFKETIEGGYFFVDKSAFIAEVLHVASKVLLFPRPRRFGKTMNLSMLRYFFQKSDTDHSLLFNGLAVAGDDQVMVHQGRYPTLSISFKGMHAQTFEACLSKVQRLMAGLYDAHRYLLESIALSDLERNWFSEILEMRVTREGLEESHGKLTRYLHRYHDVPVMLLIDEYDSPIHAGYQMGWYQDIIGFMRGFLGSALKDNNSLKQGILTGILRVARESIFSGLNNITVYGMLSARFSTAFGFTQAEVDQALEDFDRIADAEGVRTWYNSYLFAGNEVYNPWSVAGCLQNPDDPLQPYWINTSGNEIIRELVMQNDLRQDLETLLSGGTLLKPLNENVSFRDLERAPDNIWSLFTFSGYLKVAGGGGDATTRMYGLTIPNLEVQTFFETVVTEWAHKHFGGKRLDASLQALLAGEFELFEDYLSEMIRGAASYHDIGDEPESFYHAFVLGMLTGLKETHHLRSNRESGLGRYDVILEPKNKSRLGFVLEFKKVNTRREKGWEEAMTNALQQIRERDYGQELKDRGVSKVMGVGVVFSGKDTHVQGISL